MRSSTLTPIPRTHLETIGGGATSAAFSGELLQKTYAATAVFDFKTSAPEALDLNRLSDHFVGIGFDRPVINLVDNTPPSESFYSLTGSNGAVTFFAPWAFDLAPRRDRRRKPVH